MANRPATRGATRRCLAIHLARRRAVLTVALGLVLAATSATPALAQSSAVPSPTIAGAQFLQPNVSFGIPLASAYESSDEGGWFCPMGGVQANRSFWFRVRGTGGRLTFTTDFSATVPDTIIFTYGPNTTPPAGVGACNNDLPGNGAQASIQNSVPGATYHVSFGVCVNNAGTTYCGTNDGPIEFAVISNDQREFADTMVNETRTNVGATTEPGEHLDCNGVPFHHTVWYRYVAPAKGRVTLAASSPNTDAVLALYRGASPAAAACNDNSATNPLRSEIAADVAAGEELFLQIGSRSASGGGLILSADFAEDTDVDDDGYPRATDCNDTTAAIKPGAAEIPNNTVDENCDGALADDRDGDGFVTGSDCNDDDKNINPKARDIPGDKLDQDCSGTRAPLRRFAGVMDIGASTQGAVTTVKSFYRTQVPKGATLRLVCKGRWCKRTTWTIRVRKARRRVDVARLLRSRRVPPGTVLELRITRKEFRGEALRATIRNGKAPLKRRLCAAPGKRFTPC